MSYTIEGLKDMILELHPEIVQHALNISVTFDEAKNAFVLKFNRGGRELITYLDKRRAPGRPRFKLIPRALLDSPAAKCPPLTASR